MKKYVIPCIQCMKVATEHYLLAGSGGVGVSNGNHEQQPPEVWGPENGSGSGGKTGKSSSAKSISWFSVGEYED